MRKLGNHFRPPQSSNFGSGLLLFGGGEGVLPRRLWWSLGTGMEWGRGWNGSQFNGNIGVESSSQRSKQSKSSTKSHTTSNCPPNFNLYAYQSIKPVRPSAQPRLRPHLQLSHTSPDPAVSGGGTQTELASPKVPRTRVIGEGADRRRLGYRELLGTIGK